MDFSKMDIDKRFLFDYIKRNKLNDDKTVGIANLYKNYNFVTNLKKNNLLDNKSLLDYENEIYTVNGSKLIEKQKIEIEFNRIEKMLLESEGQLDDLFIDKLKEDIMLLKNIFIDYCNEIDNDMLYYIKKNISLIEAKLGVDSYFLSAAYDMFYELYFDIYYNNFELKENL